MKRIQTIILTCVAASLLACSGDPSLDNFVRHDDTFVKQQALTSKYSPWDSNTPVKLYVAWQVQGGGGGNVIIWKHSGNTDNTCVTTVLPSVITGGLNVYGSGIGDYEVIIPPGESWTVNCSNAGGNLTLQHPHQGSSVNDWIEVFENGGLGEIYLGGAGSGTAAYNYAAGGPGDPLHGHETIHMRGPRASALGDMGNGSEWVDGDGTNAATQEMYLGGGADCGIPLGAYAEGGAGASDVLVGSARSGSNGWEIFSSYCF